MFLLELKSSFVEGLLQMWWSLVRVFSEVSVSSMNVATDLT